VATRSSVRSERRGLEELLLLSGLGDVDAFARVYDELAPRVHGLSTRLHRAPAAAEAVTEEAFLEAWRRAPSYDPTRSGAEDWVMVLACSVALRSRGDESRPAPGR
jgi:RNA polymerase sigma-70 factor (ECF subfamily)